MCVCVCVCACVYTHKNNREKWQSLLFDVLLIVHLSIFILVINLFDAQNFVLH